MFIYKFCFILIWIFQRSEVPYLSQNKNSNPTLPIMQLPQFTEQMIEVATSTPISSLSILI